jgi:DNA-binding response OmpR family regulator
MHPAADILLIDDDPATVRLLVDLLRGHGFRLRVALDGRDGHRKALENPPDVILLDVCMPEMDGHHLCRLLKDDPRTADVPVIFLTGKDAPADKLNGFGAGGSDYITKPYQVNELVARLQVHGQIRRRLHSVPPTVPPATPQLKSHDDRLLHRAMEILRADLAEPPSLVDLARRAGSNERGLTELFRRRLGLPVFAWLREERHRRACDLLLSTDRDIGEIAADVGYSNAAAFATAFRERYGLTPSAYRHSAGLPETTR